MYQAPKKAAKKLISKSQKIVNKAKAKKATKAKKPAKAKKPSKPKTKKVKPSTKSVTQKKASAKDFFKLLTEATSSATTPKPKTKPTIPTRPLKNPPKNPTNPAKISEPAKSTRAAKKRLFDQELENASMQPLTKKHKEDPYTNGIISLHFADFST